MADHPMQCYPGQFEPWRRGELAPMQTVRIDDWSNAYDGLETRCVAVGDIVGEAGISINRMMSGQITTRNSNT